MNGLYGDIKQMLTLGGMAAGEAKAVALLLLEKACGLSVAQVLTGEADRMPQADAQRVRDMAALVAQGMPVQYALGEADFCGLTLHVAPGVLIPRPETEELVQWVATVCPKRILDIGTGSGCIAIALAHLLPQATVEAWDVSDDALRIARSNAERCGVNVTFRQVDVLSPRDEAGPWDVLVSNPPYICEEEAKEMETNVLEHEPRLALFVPNDDPLRFYRHIAERGLTMLRGGGRLFFEINQRFGTDTTDLLQRMGYQDVELRQDLQGHDRMVMAIKPQEIRY